RKTRLCTTKRKSTRLALAELEAAASALLAVLLAFLHAWIARQKAVLAQAGAELGIKPRDGAGKSHADRASLATGTAALHGSLDFELLLGFCELERLDGGGEPG